MYFPWFQRISVHHGEQGVAEFTAVGAFSHVVHIMVDGSGSRKRGEHGGRALTLKAPPLELARWVNPLRHLPPFLVT